MDFAEECHKTPLDVHRNGYLSTEQVPGACVNAGCATIEDTMTIRSMMGCTLEMDEID